MNTKKNIFLWVLYDFANSIVAVVFFLYFAQWIVIERGVADIWFNLTFTASALLLLLTVPTTGVLLDKYWRRIVGLRYTTLGTGIFYGLCAVFVITGQNVPALVTFTLGMYFYLLSFTFYTPLLKDISSPERRGRVSGFGIAANYIGQIAGIVLVIPFANGAINFFHSSPRAETLLPSVIAFLVCTLPMLIFFKEPPKQLRPFFLKDEVRATWRETRALLAYPGVFAFFLAYFLFNDAITTAINNFSIFLEQVWHVSDTIKSYILLGILLTSTVGGAVAGFITDKIGHKRSLVYILSIWVFIFPILALSRDFTLFIVTITLMGFLYGATWVVSRALMSNLAPFNQNNLTFAYYGLVERASSFVGPIVWGGIATGMVSLGPDRYRLAAGVLTIFIILGLIALFRVPNTK